MNTIWILYTFNRWDEDYPWDIVGFVETKEAADKWVSEARTDGCRKSEKVIKIAK